MNLFTKTNHWIAISPFIFSSMFGQDDSCCSPKKCIPIQETFCLTPGYNAPSRTAVQRCWDVYSTASFIYWNPTQENMELGIVSNTSNASYAVNGNIVNLDFKYQPGFKVGLGMNLDWDHWDTYLEYTWLRGNHKTHTSLTPSGTKILYPTWQIPDASAPKYYDGKENWQLHMDLLDLELARHYSVGTQLSFRPYFGARAAWIRQDIHVDYLNVTSIALSRKNVYIIEKSHSWAVGPRIGLTSDWMLGKCFKIYGDGSLDILYTQYTNLSFSQKATSANGTVISGSLYSIKQKDDHHLRAHLDLELGFGWGTYFADNKWHIDFIAGYEYQVFFNQNMFRSFVDDQALGKAISPHGNLYIHGLTATARLDF